MLDIPKHRNPIARFSNALTEEARYLHKVPKQGWSKDSERFAWQEQGQ